MSSTDVALLLNLDPVAPGWKRLQKCEKFSVIYAEESVVKSSIMKHRIKHSHNF